MSRADLLNEIICYECGHIADLHGLTQCYGDEQKCKCSNKLGILITVLEEDANWSSCELEDVKKECDALRKQLDVAVAGIQIAKLILEHHELHWARRLDDATNKLQITLAEIQKVGKDA
jgi:hypothetical protein